MSVTGTLEKKAYFSVSGEYLRDVNKIKLIDSAIQANSIFIDFLPASSIKSGKRGVEVSSCSPGLCQCLLGLPDLWVMYFDFYC